MKQQSGPLVHHVEVPILPLDIVVCASCNGATVGPTFYVTGTWSSPDKGGCKCVLSPKPQQGSGSVTVGNVPNTQSWRSQSFSGVSDGTYTLDAIGYINSQATCDGSISSNTTITVSANSRNNTCCVGGMKSPETPDYEAKKPGIAVRSFAHVLDMLEGDTPQVVRITVDADEVPYVAFGGRAPEEAKVTVLFGPKLVALRVQQHDGKWHALRENVGVNQEYPVQVTIDEAKESLLLKVERGKMKRPAGVK